jgi:hypothetical protein
MVQVDPIQPKLKPPGTKGLKLECDRIAFKLCFQINLRRSTTDLALKEDASYMEIMVGQGLGFRV